MIRTANAPLFRCCQYFIVAVLCASPPTGPHVRAEEEPAGTPIAALERTTEVDFHKEILPLLRRSCLACHNATDAESGLVLETPAAMLEGGSEGPAVVPGDAAESLLLQVAAFQREPVMPPEDNGADAPPLTSAELGLLKLWIDQGAKATGSASGDNIAWRPLPAHVSPILSVAIDRHGDWAVAGRGNRLHVYHVPSGQLVQELIDPAVTTGAAAHLDLVQSLAIHPDATLVASGGYQTVKLWRRQPEKVLAEKSLGTDITCVAADGNGQRLAVGTTGGEVRLFTLDAEQGPDATLTGHTGSVHGVQFIADGKSLLTGGADGILRVWTLGVAEPRVAIKTPSAILALAAVGDRWITAGADHVVRVWAAMPEGPEGAAPQPLWELAGHTGPVTCLAAPQAASQTVVSGSADGSVKIWSLDSGAAVRTIATGSPVMSLAVADDASRIVSAGEAPGVKLWDASEGKLIQEIAQDIAGQQQRGDLQREIDLAQAETNAAQGRVGELEKQIASQQEAVTKAEEALAKTASDLAEKQQAAEAAAVAKATAETAANLAEKAVADAERLVQLTQQRQQADQQAWDAYLAELAAASKTFGDSPPESVAALAAQVSAANGTARESRTQQIAALDTVLAKLNEMKQGATPLRDQTKKALEEATKKAEEAEKAHQDAKRAEDEAKINLEQAQRDVERSQVALAERQEEKQTWEAQGARFTAAAQSLDASLPDAVPRACRVAFVGSGQRFLVGDSGHRVHVFDSATGSLLSVFTRHAAPVTAVFNVAGTDTALTLSSAGQLLAWQTQRQWELERTLGGPNQSGPLVDRVLCLDISHDGRLLAAGSGQPSRSGPVTVFDLESGDVVLDLPEAHSDTVYGVQLSRDGKLVASSAADRMARVFDVATGELLRTLEGHTHHVLDVAWQANDRMLVTAGADTVLKVWDFETGEQKRTISGSNKEVTSVSFVGIGGNTLSGSGDNNVRLHNSGDGKTLRTMNSGDDFIYAAAVSADGQRVVAGGTSGTLRIWNGEDGKLLHALEPPRGEP